MSRTFHITNLIVQLVSVSFTFACESDVDRASPDNIGGFGGASTSKTSTDSQANLGGGGASNVKSSPLIEGTCDSVGNCSGLTEQELPCKDAPMPLCILSCATENRESKEAQCVGKVWKCPTGTVEFESCAQDSCAASISSCCNQATGIIDWPACGADGKVLACASGTVQTPKEGCIPTSLGVTDCMKLQGLSCDGTVLRCDQHVKFCDCAATESGELKWSCYVNLI
jgi:hypothetical protein